MRRIATLCAVVVGAVALAGCGGDDTAAPEATEAEPATTMQMETEASPAGTAPEETSAAPAKPKPKPKPKTVTIRVVGGVPQGGIARPKVEKGERVVLVIRSDAGESVHLHGYNVERAITPGKPVRLPFTATIPGRFEVELHHPDALLAVVSVTP